MQKLIYRAQKCGDKDKSTVNMLLKIIAMLVQFENFYKPPHHMKISLNFDMSDLTI